MARVARVAISIFVMIAPSAAKPLSATQPQTTMEHGCVTRFYGVPLELKFADLGTLKFDHTTGFVSGEGDYYPAATLLVGKNVLLQAEFSDDKESRLYRLTTSSPTAIGPGGVAIGATLNEVRKTWPKGEFYWTVAHGEYVAFKSGANVYFEFDPMDMPPEAFDNPPIPIQDAKGNWVSPPRKKVVPDAAKLKVKSIRISNGDIFEDCRKPSGKK